MADRAQDMHNMIVERERETWEKIKIKVERIKTNQRKSEPSIISAKTHHEGNLVRSNSLKKLMNYKT